jgi:lysyl-tRNA synthetase class 2
MPGNIQPEKSAWKNWTPAPGIDPSSRAGRPYQPEAVRLSRRPRAASNSEPVVVTLAGRLRSIARWGKITFAHIEDGDGRIQLFLRANEIGPEAIELFNREFDLGDFVQAAGEMFRTKTGEVTLRVQEFRLLSKSITPLPAAKDEVVDGQVVRHATLAEPEVRYRQRYADLAVNPEVRRIFRVRADATRAVREFLDSHGFLEVETPVLQPIYGGAAARPFVTHHNQLKQDLYLRISFELYLKRLLVGGFERVYEIGRDFRNEGVDRTHNPEFTMLEFYWACDYQQVMALTEEMVVYVADQVLGRRTFTFGHGSTSPALAADGTKIACALAGIDIDQHPTAEPGDRMRFAACSPTRKRRAAS